MKPRDIALALLVCLVWASNQVMSKIIVGQFGVPPIFYALARTVIIVIVLFPMLRPVPAHVGRIMLVGTLLGGGGFALNFLGLQYATPSSAAIVLQLSVPMATLLSILVLGERIRWKRTLGICLAFSGVIVLLWDPKGMDMSYGLLFTAGSALSSALGAILLKRIAPVPPLRIQVWGGLASIPLLSVLSFTLEPQPIQASIHAGWPFVLAVTASALIVSIFSHTAYYGLVQKYEANQIVSLMLVHSLMTIALGVMITGDHFTLGMAIGSAMTLVGVFIVAVRSGRNAPRPT